MALASNLTARPPVYPVPMTPKGKKAKLKHTQAILKKKRGHLKLSTQVTEKGNGL